MYQLTAIINRLQVSLKHLEAISTTRSTATATAPVSNDVVVVGKSSAAAAVGVETTTTTKMTMESIMSTTAADIETALAMINQNSAKLAANYDKAPKHSRSSSFNNNHRISGASTHSGCGGVEDDECNHDDENEGRPQPWDTDWDLVAMGH